MRRAGAEIPTVVGTLAAGGGAHAKARRAAEVAVRWKEAVVRVYGERSVLILSHTNAVYILKEEDGRHLVVYSDDSLVRADLDAMQEFLKMSLANQGEKIDKFTVRAARGDMRARKAYGAEATADFNHADEGKIREKVRSVKLSDTAERKIDETLKDIEDENVKKALKKAMSARFKSQSLEIKEKSYQR